MSQSLYSSLSGLNAFSAQIAAISNNIANQETTGYKTGNMSFAEVISSTIASTTSGNGVSVDDLSVLWTQGSLSATGNTYDLAINGSGFFLVENNSGGTFYTRDGSFDLDESGTLVNADNLALQGYALAQDGAIGALADINMSAYEYIEPAATSTVTVSVNLNSDSAISDSYSTTIATYDSLGNKIPLEIEFTKTAADTWTWAASIDSASGTAAGSGTLNFDTNGSLVAGTDPAITLTLSNGATATQTITWNMYDDSGATNGTLSQYASASLLSNQTQDGNSVGTLSSVSIDENGVISGTYSNNMVENLYQIALATFINNDGLKMSGSSLYEATTTSGTAIVGASGTGGSGTLKSGSVEMSNVDLASQMANLLVAQRAYQACAKVITAQDEMLQATLQMT